MSMFMTADDGTGKPLNPSDDFLRDVIMNLCVTLIASPIVVGHVPLSDHHGIVHGSDLELRTILHACALFSMIAGRDTTANALSWIFYELVQNPDVVCLFGFTLNGIPPLVCSECSCQVSFDCAIFCVSVGYAAHRTGRSFARCTLRLSCFVVCIW
jgi:hypothetical protein